MAICEALAREIKLARKIDFSDEKLAVKSVTKPGGIGSLTYMISFENGKVEKLSEYGGSINAIIHSSDREKLTETYRITVRKK